MVRFVRYEPSQANAVVRSASSVKTACMPFAEALLTISKAEYIRLKWEAEYWQRQHQRAVLREEGLESRIEELQAQVRDLRQRLFGRKSEKSGAPNEGQAKGASSRRRGQQLGSRGHGRTSWAHLPVHEEDSDLSDAEKRCPDCGKPVVEFPGTEDSEVIEIEVQAYRRVIHRKRYRPDCHCEKLPGIITASAPARLIPKGLLGVSVWVEILLGKYLYAQPTNRWLQAWASVGLKLSQGTIVGGFKRMAPLFIPVVEALQARQLTDGYCHADETGWKVFEPIDGKVGYRWYLWVIRSASAMVYVMAPGRGASVPLAYFAKLLVQTIVVCDRYAAYKKFARTMGVLLAFCWAHVRRDWLELARGYPALQPWAMCWVERIGTLYHLNECRLTVQADPAGFAARDAQLKAHLQHMEQQCEADLADPTVRPAARKVLQSLQKHWEGLTVFVAHREIAMDNNKAESALRNEVLGRKAYYGSGSVWAAELAGLLFSILMTLVHCWQINPRRWLQEYLQACADQGHQPPKDLSPFLPWAMSAERLAALQRHSDFASASAPLGTGLAMDTS